MIKTSARRFPLALILGAASLVFAASAHADGVTGTDPCPKGMFCTAGTTTANSSSTTSTLFQVAMVILGVS